MVFHVGKPRKTTVTMADLTDDDGSFTLVENAPKGKNIA